nr:YnbE family lipoprotein [Sphingomonas gellani]
MAVLGTIVLAGAGCGGCVNISAPEKPIEINLNISVTQEVVYRLDNEAKTLIQQNPGIF